MLSLLTELAHLNLLYSIKLLEVISIDWSIRLQKTMLEIAQIKEFDAQNAGSQIRYLMYSFPPLLDHHIIKQQIL